MPAIFNNNRNGNFRIICRRERYKQSMITKLKIYIIFVIFCTLFNPHNLCCSRFTRNLITNIFIDTFCSSMSTVNYIYHSVYNRINITWI